MKKNKDIEVLIEESSKNKNGETITVHEMKIGKKTIGTVEVLSANKFEVYYDNELISTVKGLDEAFEEIIRQWNLFQ
ncbi:DUF2969 family protein [Vagococcus xieshaowenii]|uniref:DUF2969 family protein n=1 Tax=Vagococcus xieshaowenii TaxID=2562451 RepID=A0AAJ5EGQ0_9ENTE|nr:DUF2969 family protein [Vagococcus xieshaowenii]QCA28519.1 DUF2969 family protein [Vagococcus xieshaowenii]TFZ42728.1 DUF2969 family protein [Vagococcus xieshaowenii]